MTASKASIAIVGAGLGGLALASILDKKGIAVDVYEQAPRFARVGAGINLSPNATRVLDGLGVLDKLRLRGHRPPAWQSLAWDTGALLGEITLGAEAEAKYGTPFMQTHRADLHAMLVETVPAERIHLGKKLAGVEPNGDGVVLEFTDGSTARADVVIGADGIHSRIREIIVGKEELSFTGRVAYRGVISADRIGGIDLNPMAKWWGPDRHIVIYYITNPAVVPREIYYVTSVPANGWLLESWSARGDVTELRDEFRGFHPQVQAVLNGCEETFKWALYDRNPLEKPWWSDRLAILGDACHPMTPYIAQGAAMAMEDAVVLARCLEASGNWSQAFRMYQATRSERTGRMQLVSRANQFMRKTDDPSWMYAYDAWTTPLLSPSVV